MTTIRTITARPAGHDRHGQPIREYTYVIDRDPEPFGEGTSRIFAENRSTRTPRGGHYFTPIVVLNDTICDAAAVNR